MTTREYEIRVDRAWGVSRDEDLRDVLIDCGGHIVVLQVEASPMQAEILAHTLRQSNLTRLFQERDVRRGERIRAHIAEQDATQEQERPAREKAERERAKRAAAAPRVQAAKCPECLHVAMPDEFDERGYECGGCGSTGRGADERRCDQCHRFRARVTDLTCPSCEQPLEEEETVTAVDLDGELVEVASS